MRTTPIIWAAALAAALCACSHPTQPVLTAANAQKAYEIGKRLAAQDRAGTARRRREMARLIDARVSQTHEADRVISLLLHVHNRSAKVIRALEAGLEVHDAHGKRIGMAEIAVERPIAAHGTLRVWYPVRYVRFGEDAGTMVLAAGKPKTVRIDVTEIKYADGSDAGYDD